MGMKLFVGNLARHTTAAELVKLFSAFGIVKWADVALDPITGGCKGFGFVQMNSDAQGRLAVSNLHGTAFNGRLLRVGKSGDPTACPQRDVRARRRRS